MKIIEQCDEAAASIARGYAALGVPAFTIRTTPDGSGVSIIGPALKADQVAKMLRAAAAAWADRARQLN